MTSAISHQPSSEQPSLGIAALHALPRRTIAVTARTRSRFSRLKARYPDRADHPSYDAALAGELLGRTGELPHSKHDLVVVLTEYRHALYDLITGLTGKSPAAVMNGAPAQTTQHEDQPAARTVA